MQPTLPTRKLLTSYIIYTTLLDVQNTCTSHFIKTIINEIATVYDLYPMQWLNELWELCLRKTFMTYLYRSSFVLGGFGAYHQERFPNSVSFSGWKRVALKKRNSRFFRTLLWQTVIFFTLLDRTSISHYNDTKIIKFGWKLFILWVISYRLSFLGFAINLSSCLETLEIGQITIMTVHKKCLIK